VKENSQRIFILVIVALFLVSTFAFTGFVLYDHFKNKDKTADSTSDIQKQLQDQVNKQTNNQKEGKLQGTQLADFTPIPKVDSLQKIDTVVGTGDEVKPGDTVTAHYTGAIASTGKIFQSSHDSGNPVPFGLDQVIKGWTEGVPGMKVGGKRRLIIPAAQAYGAQSPSPDIPANSDLVFDIELVKIGQ